MRAHTPNIYQVRAYTRYEIVNTLTGNPIDDDYDTAQAAQEQADAWNAEESTLEWGDDDSYEWSEA